MDRTEAESQETVVLHRVNARPDDKALQDWRKRLRDEKPAADERPLRTFAALFRWRLAKERRGPELKRAADDAASQVKIDE